MTHLFYAGFKSMYFRVNIGSCGLYVVRSIDRWLAASFVCLLIGLAPNDNLIPPAYHVDRFSD